MPLEMGFPFLLSSVSLFRDCFKSFLITQSVCFLDELKRRETEN